MNLGADQCLKGWLSQAAFRHGEGGIHDNLASGHWSPKAPLITLNPVSGILTELNTYQREGGEGKGLKIKQGK